MRRKMAKAEWCGQEGCEEAVKEKTTVTLMVMPFDEKAKGPCFRCGKKALHVAYFSKAY
ncbi:MAG: hypothetical protein HYX24_03290 [Candidatus Aenigmarchaeota archaeon]|nr:hypothetical protein [Candidatus Aenigmarchaeota archaeon]